MADSIVFDCPHCGGAIEVPKDATEAVCTYCGRSAPVPPELRPARSPLPDGGRTMRVSDGAGGVVDVKISRTTKDGVHMEVLPPQPFQPMTPQQQRSVAGTRRSGLGCCLAWVLVPLLIIAAIRLWFFLQYHTASDAQVLVHQLLPCTPPQVPSAGMGSLAALPLHAQYSGAKVVVTSVSLTNRAGLFEVLFGGLASCSEYFRVDGFLENSGSDPVVIPDGWVRLQAASGSVYPYVSGWSGTLTPDDDEQLDLIFEVPAGTTVAGFRLLMGPEDEQPAVVALDTRLRVATCSGALAPGKSARAQGVTYRVTSAALAEDYDGQSAPSGQCYLVVGLRMSFPAGSAQASSAEASSAEASSILSATQQMMGAISATQELAEVMAGQPQARLTIGDTTLAPSGLKPISTQGSGPFELEEAFLVPQSTTRATLQVGDPDQPGTATIQLAAGG
jgi:hypothetical protein